MLDMTIFREKFAITLEEFEKAQTAQNATFLVDEKGEVWSVWQKLTQLPIITLCNFKNTKKTQTIAFNPQFGTVKHGVEPSNSVQPIIFYVVGEREILPGWRDYCFIVRSEVLNKEWVIGPFIQPDYSDDEWFWREKFLEEEKGVYDVDFQISFITGYQAKRKLHEAIHIPPGDFIRKMMMELNEIEK